MKNEEEQWIWQEPETAWKGVGIYHITMVVSSRKPLLGELVIPDNDPEQTRVEWSDIDPKKKQVTRAECVAMNQMAEEICSIIHCSE